MKITALTSLIENFDFSGVSFISIKGYYSDSSGEVSDVLINVGASYKNMKTKDLETLQGADALFLETQTAEFDVDLLTEAIEAKIKSIVSPNKNRSQGQKNAYINLNERGTLKYCKNTKSVLIQGTVIRKTVLVKGEYKAVKSRLALAKKHIDKVLDLRCAKMRYYKLSNIAKQVRVSGNTIEIL